MREAELIIAEDNLAPRAYSRDEDGDGYIPRGAVKMRTAATIGRIRNRLTNLTPFSEDSSPSSSPGSHSHASDACEEEIFQSKMQALMKNPMIFRELKTYLAEKETTNSKEEMFKLLHDFLDNHLRMPELRDDITKGVVADPVPRRRVGLFAYLAGESSTSTTDSHQNVSNKYKEDDESSSSHEKSIFFSSYSSLVGSAIPHMEATEGSYSECDGSMNDNCSTASF